MPLAPSSYSYQNLRHATQPAKPSVLESIGILFAIAGVLSCMVLNIIPVGAITDDVLDNITRALPIVLVVGAVPFLLVGTAGQGALRTKPILAGLLLALLMIGGSLLYIFENGASIADSFLVRGVCALALFAGAAIGANQAKRRKFARIVAAAAVVTGTAGVLLMLLFQFAKSIEFEPVSLKGAAAIFIAGPTFYAIRNRAVVVAIALAAGLGALGYLSEKSTFYLLALMVLGVYFSGTFLRWMKRMMQGRSAATQAGLASALIPMAIGLVLVLSNLLATVIDERMSRNIENDVRRKAYEFRLQQFSESPLFGKFFNMSSNMADVMGFGTTIPSHNDILDLAAAGGIVAIVLFLMIIGAAVLNRMSLQQMSTTTHGLTPEMYFWCLLIFYLVSATGNPFFSNPKMAVLIWFSAGFMGSYARDPAPAPASVPTRRQPPTIGKRPTTMRRQIRSRRSGTA